MKKLLKKSLPYLLAGNLLFSSCEKKNPVSFNNDSDLILNKNTIVLEEENLDTILNVSEDEISFSQETDYSVGDIIVAGIGEKTPKGLMVKVEENLGEKIKVSPACLEESVSEGKILFYKKLNETDLSLNSPMKISSPNLSEYDFYQPIDKIILDLDGDYYTIDDQLKLEGYFGYNVDLGFELNFDSSKKELKNSSLVEGEGELELKGDIDKNFNKKIDFSKLNFAPIPLIGTPFYLSPELELYLNFEGNLNGKVETGIEFDFKLYQENFCDSSGWKVLEKIEETNLKAKETFVENDLMLKAGIGEKISFMINNVAGPFVSLEEYLKLEANIFSNPWWNLKAGVDFGVGANPGLFSYFIPEWRSVLFNYEKVLSSAEEEDFLPVAKLNISPKEGVVPLKVLLDASSSESFSGVEKYYFVFGDGKEYTESEDSNDGNFDGKTLHVYEKGGIYYPEVNIWDKKGRTSKASETLETKVGWREDFENCSVNTFPNNWIPDANAKKSSSGIIEEGENKILKLYGTIDGCWGALAYREKLIDPPYEIKLKIKNGDENLGGCHPSRAMIGLREGDDWSTSGKSFVSFSEEGNLLGINGEILCETELNVWNYLKIKYDSGKIEYYLNENKIGESFYTMPNYKNLELSVNEGNAYFDDIEIMKN